MYIPDILQQLIESFNNHDIQIYMNASQSEAQAEFNANASETVNNFYEGMGNVASTSLESLKNLNNFQFRHPELYNKILGLNPALFDTCFLEFKYIQALASNLRLTDLQISQVYNVLSLYFTKVHMCAKDVYTHEMFTGIKSALQHSIIWETDQFNKLKGLIPNVSPWGYIMSPGMNLSNIALDIYKNCSQEQLRIMFLNKINVIYSNPILANQMICNPSTIVNFFQSLYAAYANEYFFNWNVKWETCVYIFLSGFLKHPIDTVNLLLHSVSGSLTMQSLFSSVDLIGSNTAPTGLVESGTIESNPIPIESGTIESGTIESNSRPAGLIGSNISPTGSIPNNPIPRNFLQLGPTPGGFIGSNSTPAGFIDTNQVESIDTTAQRLGHPMSNFREDLNRTDLALEIHQNRRMSAKDLNSYLNVMEKTG